MATDLTPAALKTAQTEYNAAKFKKDYPKMGEDQTALNLDEQNKLALLNTAKQNNDMCTTVLAKFSSSDPLINNKWTWHKNKITGGGCPMMYFIQKIEYNNIKYTALAHVHGTFVVNDWQYDINSCGGDKIEIFDDSALAKTEGECTKKTLAGLGAAKDTLKKQVPAAQFTNNGVDKKPQFPSVAQPLPARNEYFDMYHGDYGFDSMYDIGSGSHNEYYLDGSQPYSDGGSSMQWNAINGMNMEAVLLVLLTILVFTICALCSCAFGCFGGAFYAKRQNDIKREEEEDINRIIA